MTAVGDRALLSHVRDALASVADFTAGGRDAFFADPKTQFAVVRALEIVGEAVKRLSPPLKARHEDIPWRAIASMRDQLIHDYFGVDLAVVWHVVEVDGPALRARVEAILAALPEDGA